MGKGEDLLSSWNYLRPSNLVREFLKENGIDNAQGPTDKAFQEAMELYWAKRYTPAIEKFEEVLRLCPGHPDAQNYITLSQGAIARGEEVKEGFFVGMDTDTTIGLVVIVGVAAGFYLLGRRRKKAFSHPTPPPPTESPQTQICN